MANRSLKNVCVYLCFQIVSYQFGGPSASHLQVLQLPVLENSYCVQAYSRYTAQVIDDRVMCAGFKKGGKDACQGDSGGPLMQPVVSGPSASHLQVLQLPVLENSYCVQAYSRYTAQVIDDRVMCAGFKKGGKDACQEDCGGPLMQPVYNPVEFSTYFYQTGVVSFGRRCAEAGFPGIYTRVTYFVPWLQKQVLGLAE